MIKARVTYSRTKPPSMVTIQFWKSLVADQDMDQDIRLIALGKLRVTGTLR